MASKKFDKGSEEWQFFQDFWRFRQQYYEADNDEGWFVEMMRAGEQIIEKYHNTDFAKFAQSLVLSHFEDIQIRWERKCGKRK